ncbi:amidohydrolase family protein [Nocardiopsis flavescens]|uniref:amidohydrolase family protein n=1 Tax=Nocardiopsis flavescens TaxID=758803 RepID=UPI00365687A6
MTHHPSDHRPTPVPEPGRPLVFRGGTVLTMDDAGTVLTGADVLVVGGRIEAVGPRLAVPEDAREIDARGGIVMPGMVDTHRHTWQTALRGYGADWTLTQYFVWFYLEWGLRFRPQDIHAGTLLGAWEALDAGVTTTADWSHGLVTPEHADAAVDALEEVPTRYVFAYGNIHAAPWEWAPSADLRSFHDRRFHGRADDMRGFQLAFDVTGEESFPERAAFEAAREMGAEVTTHAGVWGATGDAGIRLMHDHGFMGPGTVYVHAASLSEDSYQRIAATGGSVSVSTESEQSAGQGYPPTWRLRRHGIPVSLSMDTGVWWSADLFSAMRATLGADRSREHLRAHERGETVTHSHLRAEHVVGWATRGGARALGLSHAVGSLEPGRRADVVLLRNDTSPAMFPLLNPYGHVAFQAQRADVHTVVVDGRVVKHEHRLVGADMAAVRRAVESTLDYLREVMGDRAWEQGMNPDVPDAEVLDNPYTYTGFRDASTHRRREGAPEA